MQVKNFMGEYFLRYCSNRPWTPKKILFSLIFLNCVHLHSSALIVGFLIMCYNYESLD